MIITSKPISRDVTLQVHTDDTDTDTATADRAVHAVRDGGIQFRLELTAADPLAPPDTPVAKKYIALSVEQVHALIAVAQFAT